MNILIPDGWLREFLQTKATPRQIKEYLSLCGPSVERIHEVNKETVYDIEVTTNRPDAMSVVGIAREAAAILPRFGIQAKLTGDPYERKINQGFDGTKKLHITTDAKLNPRFTAVIFENVHVGSSPAWLAKKLEQTGIRSINNVVDITNYLMRAYGQPAHVFDYDAVGGQTMILRASKKGETITTLDGKTYTIPGEDIVIEDGDRKLIDLAGIMGGQNSCVKETTQNVILFLQTYDPVHIRKTSMTIAARSEASGLFEKGLDTELVLPVMMEGIRLMKKLTGGQIASKVYDLYPKPFVPYTVRCSREKIDSYIGVKLSDSQIKNILSSLGFVPKITKQEVMITVPSFRRDVAIDVDIIEEIARIYGYHNIKTKLPENEPPMVFPDPTLTWEEEIKTRLRDWGFTETYTYSMISEKLMDAFDLDKTKAYKITNPLSEEWVYLRPSLIPSVIDAIKQNMRIRKDLSLFELSMVYRYRQEDLPVETPMLVVAKTGNAFFAVKGIAQALFSLFGITFPQTEKEDASGWFSPSLTLGEYGRIGVLADTSITILELDVSQLVAHANHEKSYQPIPKYPPVVEDMSFTVPAGTHVGPMMEAIKHVSHLISGVTILDSYENSRTFHISYMNPKRNLTNEDVAPIREKIIAAMEEMFSAIVKASA